MERKTMLKLGRIKETMEEIVKARVDVVVVQQIRWKKQGIIDKKYIFLFSTVDPKIERVVMGKDLL